MAECFPVKKCTTSGGQHGDNEDPAQNGGSMPGGNGGFGIVKVVEVGKAEAPAKLGPAVG